MIFKLIFFFFRTLSLLSPLLASKAALHLFCKPKRYSRSGLEQKFWDTGEAIPLKSGRTLKKWGQGPALFFLHGWESRGSFSYGMARFFMRNGYTVYLWDAPAHGDSPGESANIKTTSEALKDDLSDTKINPYALVAHSFGGALIPYFNKIHSIPKKLIIIGSPARLLRVFDLFSKKIGLTKRASNRLIKLAQRLLGYSLKEVSLENHDLSQITSTLLIHDLNDKEVPHTEFLRIKNKWKCGFFYTTKNLGHRRILRNPGVYQAILTHLNRSESTYS